MSLVWPKLFKLIDIQDWDRVKTLSVEIKHKITYNCKHQEDLLIKYNSNISNESQNNARDVLAILIANSIVFELQNTLTIEDKVLRKSRIKILFEELISIQFPLKSADFSYYKSLHRLIKNMYFSSSQNQKLEFFLSQNPYYASIIKTCL